MVFRATIWLRHARGDHCRSLHGSWLSTRRSPKHLQTDGRHHECCSFETSTYDASANFDFNNVPFKSYANAARQSHADSDCRSHGLDCARAYESRYILEASGRATRIHW